MADDPKDPEDKMDLDSLLRDILNEKPSPAPEGIGKDLGDNEFRVEDIGAGQSILYEESTWAVDSDKEKMAALHALNNDMKLAGGALAAAFTAFGLLEQAIGDAEDVIAAMPNGPQRIKLIAQAGELASKSLSMTQQMKSIKITVHAVEDVPEGMDIAEVIRRAKEEHRRRHPKRKPTDE